VCVCVLAGSAAFGLGFAPADQRVDDFLAEPVAFFSFARRYNVPYEEEATCVLLGL
jgi:hypothetical protein